MLVSDGRINDGGDPTDAAQRLADRGVTVYTLGLGSRQVAPDAAVDSIDAPDWIYKDDTLKASALLRFDGLAGQTAKVDFLRGSTIIDTQTVTPDFNSDDGGPELQGQAAGAEVMNTPCACRRCPTKW